jgi:hypothetical protein
MRSQTRSPRMNASTACITSGALSTSYEPGSDTTVFPGLLSIGNRDVKQS